MLRKRGLPLKQTLTLVGHFLFEEIILCFVYDSFVCVSYFKIHSRTLFVKYISLIELIKTNISMLQVHKHIQQLLGWRYLQEVAVCYRWCNVSVAVKQVLMKFCSQLILVPAGITRFMFDQSFGVSLIIHLQRRRLCSCVVLNF